MSYEKFCNRKEVNLDGNHRCSLLCPNCPRQTEYTDWGLKVAGTDIPEEDFDKCIKFFGHINFEGQYNGEIIELANFRYNGIDIDVDLTVHGQTEFKDDCIIPNFYNKDEIDIMFSNVSGGANLKCEVLEFNKSVISLHKKFGFEIIKTLKNKSLRDGVPLNSVLMKLIKARCKRILFSSTLFRKSSSKLQF